MNLRKMIYASMFTAIVAALGLIPPIFLPFTPVPITAQTLGVMLAGAVLGARYGGLSLLIFVLLIAVGAPVLSGGRGGIAILFGTSGGYILSYPIAAFVIGYLVEKLWDRLNVGLLIAANVIGGILLVYAMGITYYSIIAGLSWGAAAVTALVYIPGDITKAIVASVIAMQIKRAYPLIDRKNDEMKDIA